MRKNIYEDSRERERARDNNPKGKPSDPAKTPVTPDEPPMEPFEDDVPDEEHVVPGDETKKGDRPDTDHIGEEVAPGVYEGEIEETR